MLIHQDVTITLSADKETCLDDIKLAKELQSKIANEIPCVVGPATTIFLVQIQ
jgi:hypothetical protein